MADPVAVSFEFFPPSDESMGQQLWNCVQRLAPLQPNFVSVTYGADGSTRARTHDCVLRILRETNLTVAPHLTCVGAPRGEVLRIARDYWQQGIRHLVALRGDAPANVAPDGRYRADAQGFAYASDLVAGLAGSREIRNFGGGIPGRAPGIGQRRGGFGEFEAQGRCGRAAAPSRSSSSIPMCSCAIAIAARPPAFACRWCPASCRSRAFPSCCASPSAAAHPCRRGCAAASTDWMMIPRRAA